MTEIPKAAIDAAAGKIAELRVYDNDLNYSSEEIALAVLQAAAPFMQENVVVEWMGDNGLATGHGDTVRDMLNEAMVQINNRGFTDGIEAAAKEVEKYYDPFIAAIIRALTPQAKP